jgi:hypothetical protein
MESIEAKISQCEADIAALNANLAELKKQKTRKWKFGDVVYYPNNPNRIRVAIPCGANLWFVDANRKNQSDAAITKIEYVFMYNIFERKGN